MNLTEDIPSDLLLRLRPNRCLYKSPEGYSGCGRPRKHGDKFQLANAASWGEAQSTSTLEDETIGQVQIQQWSNLHFKKSAQRHFQVIRVTHPHCAGLGLAWVGEQMPTFSHYISSALFRKLQYGGKSLGKSAQLHPFLSW